MNVKLIKLYLKFKLNKLSIFFITIYFIVNINNATALQDTSNISSVEDYIKINKYSSIDDNITVNYTENYDNIRINVDKYINEINNLHSFNIFIFNIMRGNRKYIISFDQPDKSSDMYISSSLYEKCKGIEIFISNKKNELNILETKYIGSHSTSFKYIIRKLVHNSAALAGDPEWYFSIVKEGTATRQCTNDQ